MARFTKKIEVKYGVETFGQTRKTYDWIVKGFKKWAGEKAKIKANFLFDVGDIYCSAENIEEFISIVFGNEKTFLFTQMTIIVYKGEESIHSIIDSENVRLITNDKGTLEQIVTILTETTLEEKQTATTYIENQYNGNVVNGNDNIVVSSSEKVNINKDTKQEEKTKETRFKKWLTAIGQNLLSNGIWYLLIAIGTAVITYFFTK